jgi:hypothetical protein
MVFTTAFVLLINPVAVQWARFVKILKKWTLFHITLTCIGWTTFILGKSLNKFVSCGAFWKWEVVALVRAIFWYAGISVATAFRSGYNHKFVVFFTDWSNFTDSEISARNVTLFVTATWDAFVVILEEVRFELVGLTFE